LQVVTFTDDVTSVADPGCLSRIPDPKTATKERGEKKLDVKPFYVATKFIKIVNYFSFEVLKKKIWANFQRIIELFTKKIVIKLFKIWSWDPGSEIRDPEKTHSGSRIQGSKMHRIPDPGSGSATLDVTLPSPPLAAAKALSNHNVNVIEPFLTQSPLG
jgi:hypothetical protein